MTVQTPAPCRGGPLWPVVTIDTKITTQDLPAFAPVALAGLHDLPDTIMTRAVLVRVRKRAPHEQVEPFRPRQHRDALLEVHDRLAAWAEVVEPALKDVWPVLPDGIEDRNADVWEPLIAIADAAGGSWPERARVAAVALVALAQNREPGYSVQLLKDICTVFNTRQTMSTDDLLHALHALDEAPWATGPGGRPLDSRKLAKMLAAFDIKPKLMRTGGRVLRGYERASFDDPWTRYLAQPTDEPTEEVIENGQPPCTVLQPLHPQQRIITPTPNTKDPHVQPDRLLRNRPGGC